MEAMLRGNIKEFVREKMKKGKTRMNVKVIITRVAVSLGYRRRWGFAGSIKVGRRVAPRMI
jgi:hypothetical protein